MEARAAAEKLWNLGESDRVSIWVDCDTGHDDAFAILLAALTPRVNLLGVSTVHGNASLENTTRNSLSILEAIGRRDVEVFPGASKPFCRDAVYAENIHGDSGLDGTTILPKPVRPIPSPTRDNTAVHAMYNALSKTAKGTAWLVSTGTLTNIALLFALYPSLVDHIAGLSIMGGAIGGFFTHAPLGRVNERIELSKNIHKLFPGGWQDGDERAIAEVVRLFHETGLIKGGEKFGDERVGKLLEEARRSFGNTTPWAEFNIYCDPEAANSIFSSSILAAKTTLIPLDITHQVLANLTISKKLLLGPSGAGSPVRQLFNEILQFFTSTYEREFAMNTGPPLHDPVAVAAAFCPDLFDDNKGERYIVYVVTEGDDSLTDHGRGVHNVGQCGRTVVRLLGEGEEGVRIPRTLDVGVFWDLIDLALAEAEKRSLL